MAYYSGFFPTTLGAQAPLPMRTVAKHPRSEAKGGTLNSVIQYTAFGEIRSTQGVTPTKYRYTGQLAQAELGLDYYVSRWYDPLTGHFTQADTLIPEPGEASAFDRYAYVQNNPLKYNDPSGHDVGCAGTDASNCRKWNNVIDRNLGYKNRAPSYLEIKEQRKKPYSPYMQGWTNTQTAWSIYTNSGSSIAEKYGAAIYMGFWVGAHSSLVVGLAGLSYATSGPTCVTAIEGTLGIRSAGNINTINQYWTKTVEFLGKKVYQRPDIFEWSNDNIQRMQRGLAPIGIDGRSIELHHLLQSMEGPIAEVTRSFHQTYSTILNINPNSLGSGIDRVAFGEWRTNYWIQRVAEHLGK